MADFYPVLKRAVAALPAGNTAGRQVVYRRARLALDRQLAGYDPPLPQPEIDDQRAALDRAIARIETELGTEGDVLLAGRPDTAVAPASSPAPVSNEVAAMPPKSGAASALAAEPLRPIVEAAKPVQTSRWSFSRGKAPAAESVQAEPEIKVKADISADPAERAEPTVGAVAPNGNGPSEPATSGLGAMSRLAASHRRLVRDEGVAKAEHEAHPQLSQVAAEPLAFDDVPTDARIMLQAHPTLLSKVAAFAKNPVNFSVFVVFILVILVGSFGWFQREQLAQWFHPAKAGVSGVQASDATNDGLGPKIEDRLPPDESLGTSNADAKSVATQKVTAGDKVATAAGPTGATVTYSEDSSASSTSFARNNEAQKNPSTPDVSPSPNSVAANGTAAPAPIKVIPPPVPIAISQAPQHVIVYEEPLPGSSPVPLRGTAVWSIVNQPALPGEAAVPQVRAEISIPDRDLKLTLLLRANSDPNFPASHLVDLQFMPGPQFPGRSIQLVTRLILKQTEKAGGDPLTGAVIQIIDNRFWLALSSDPDARATNVDLLRKRTWFDIPVLYGDRRKAIIALEKGDPGTMAINQGFAVFGE